MKKKLWAVVLSLAVSLVLIVALLRQLEPGDLARAFSRIHYPALAAFLMANLFSTSLRAWRYKLLMWPQRIRWTDMFLATFIRNAFDDLLPARIGSLSYIYVLNSRLGFPFETAASSFLVAFLYDFLTLSPFLVAALLYVGGSAPASWPVLLSLSFLFFLLMFLLVWKVVPLTSLFIRLTAGLARWTKSEEKPWARKILAKLELVKSSLREVMQKRPWPIIFLQSLLIRAGKYVSVYFLLFAFLRGYGFRLRDLSFAKTILGLTGAEFTAALPIKGLAGFGTWESAWVLVFKLMNFDAKLAILSGLGIHLVTNLWEYALAVLSILILAAFYSRRVT